MAQTEPDRQPALKITRMLNATRQEVFEAWLDPDSVKQWMCPEDGCGVVAELDVRVGGTFLVEMQCKDGPHINTGVYREIKAPERLVFTWVSADTDTRETLVTVELFERGHKTELVLTQVQLPDEEAVRRHVSGWTKIVENLANHINGINKSI